MRLVSLTFLFAWFLSACAVSPPPVPPPVYYPPVDYGPPGDVRNPTQGPFRPNAALYVCAGRVSNAPPFNQDGRLPNFNPIIIVENQIVMATVPANEVCLSSGYGMRNGRLHKGSDFAPRPKGGRAPRIYGCAGKNSRSRIRPRTRKSSFDRPWTRHLLSLCASKVD